MPTFYPNMAAADYLAALNALANNGVMAITNAPQTFTGLQTFSDGLAGTLSTAAQPNVTSLGTLTSLTVAAGGNVTGSTTGVVTGFKSGSFGSVGNLGALSLLGSTSGTATLTTDATATKVTLDKALDIGANALTAGAISGTTVNTGTSHVASSVLNGGTLNIAGANGGTYLAVATSTDQGISCAVIWHIRNGVVTYDNVGTQTGGTITSSGASIRFTNTSGATATVNFAAIRIA